jgi:hypothetical protein
MSDIICYVKSTGNTVKSWIYQRIKQLASRILKLCGKGGSIKETAPLNHVMINDMIEVTDHSIEEKFNNGSIYNSCAPVFGKVFTKV